MVCQEWKERVVSAGPCGKPAETSTTWFPRVLRGPTVSRGRACSRRASWSPVQHLWPHAFPERARGAPSRAGVREESGRFFVCLAPIGTAQGVLGHLPLILQAHRWSPRPECLLLRKGRARSLLGGGAKSTASARRCSETMEPHRRREADLTRKAGTVKLPSHGRSSQNWRVGTVAFRSRGRFESRARLPVSSGTDRGRLTAEGKP